MEHKDKLYVFAFTWVSSGLLLAGTILLLVQSIRKKKIYAVLWTFILFLVGNIFVFMDGVLYAEKVGPLIGYTKLLKGGTLSALYIVIIICLVKTEILKKQKYLIGH
jgi:hypothetical protein